MPSPNRVVRRPQNTLVVFDGPPATAYKLSQNDVLRLEQNAGMPLDYLTQGRLSAAMNSLGIATLPLDPQDWSEMAAASTRPAPAPPGDAPTVIAPARPVGQQPPVVPPGPITPLESTEDDETSSPKLRIGLLIAVLALAGVVLLILFGIVRLFSSPGSGGSDGTPTITVTTTTTTTGTPSPGAAAVTAVGNVNIYAGPSQQYPIVGVLPAGAKAPVVGRNPNGDWYVITMQGIPGNQGWVPASAVTAENTGSVPVATPPPLSTATATPTAAPTVPSVFKDWKGEYFANPDVAEPPVLVRNDPQINFNWGSGAPAPGIPPNNYSVRWSRRAFFEEGDYTFNANVEGGVRLWLDGRMLIDSWQSGPLRLEQADSGPIARGDHDLRVDYRKLTGNGQIAVSWQLKAQPPTAVIEGPASGQVGQELRFSARNSTAAPGTQIVRYEWVFGDGAVSDQAEVVKVYSNPGVFNVTLTVFANTGLSSQATQQVTISPQPQPPVVVINAPAQATAGQPVSFDGGQSTGQSPIVSYQWRFGDGGTADGVRVQHTYAAPGVFSVQLTVGDSAGLSGSTSLQIQINPPPTAIPTVVPEPTAVVTPIPLEGPIWQLQDTLPDTTITATFQAGRVSGSGGCNTYSGSYTISGQTMAIGPLGTTGLSCAQPVMDQETKYLATLQGAVDYEIQGNELRIDSQVGDQQIRLRFVAVQ